MNDEPLDITVKPGIDWVRPLRYLWRGPWLVLHLVLALPVVLWVIARDDDGGPRARAATHFWAATLCRIFGIRVQTHGQRCSDPVLVVANHVSWLDIMVLDAVWALSFVAKAEIRRWPVVGWVAAIGGSVFHHRGSGESRDRVSQALARRLASGHSVAIFPEGRTGPGDRVLPFHGRLFSAAVEVGCPIQPVAIRYSRGTQRTDDIPFRGEESFVTNFLRVLGEPPTVAELHFLAPIDPDGQGRRDMARAAQSEVAAIVDS